MLGHCVYIWKKKTPGKSDTILYVGASTNGIRRFAGHHVLPTTYTKDDRIELFLCKSKLDALAMEQHFINMFQPKLNIKNRAPRRRIEPHRKAPTFYFENDAETRAV